MRCFEAALFVCLLLFVVCFFIRLLQDLLCSFGKCKHPLIAEVIVNTHCHCDVLKRLCLFVCLFVVVRCFCFIRLRQDLCCSCGKRKHSLVAEVIVNIHCHCDVLKRLCLFVCFFVVFRFFFVFVVYVRICCVSVGKLSIMSLQR